MTRSEQEDAISRMLVRRVPDREIDPVRKGLIADGLVVRKRDKRDGKPGNPPFRYRQVAQAVAHNVRSTASEPAEGSQDTL